MKRRIRRVVVLTSLAIAGGVIQAQPANAGSLCAVVRVWFGGAATPAGDCVSSGWGTLICDSKDVVWDGAGGGATVCLVAPI